MYVRLMEEVVREENMATALEAVKRNQEAPGIDHMKTTELESHLQAHREKIRAKLLAGTWVPSPVRRVEIPKPSGGTRRRQCFWIRWHNAAGREHALRRLG
jgi:retron-type reverse transcriptase